MHRTASCVAAVALQVLVSGFCSAAAVGGQVDFAAPGARGSADEFESQGYLEYEKGDFVSAIESYKKAISLNPQGAELYCSRGMALIESVPERIRKDNSFDADSIYVAAIADCNRALALDPILVVAYVTRARAEQDLGCMSQCIADYRRALAIRPRDVDLYLARALAYKAADRGSEAIADLSRAIDLDRNNFECYLERGKVFERSGEFQQALSDLNEAITLKPDDARSYNHRGAVYSQLGQYQSAIQDYARAFDLDEKAAGWDEFSVRTGGELLHTQPASLHCFIDRAGKTILTFNDSERRCFRFSDGLARMQDKNGLYGYVNKQGKFVIKPQFVLADDFHEGLASVGWGHSETAMMGRIDGEGFIDRSGGLVISGDGLFSYQKFSEGLTPHPIGVRNGYMGITGHMVIKPMFEDCAQFSDGMARVRLGQKWGYIDRSGKFVIWPAFTNCCDFHDGMAAVPIFPPDKLPFGADSRVREQFAKNTRYAFIDRTGNFKGQPMALTGKARSAIDRQMPGCGFDAEDFDSAVGYSEGLAPYAEGTKYGFMNTEFKSVITAQFDDVGPFCEGLAAVCLNKKWGYIDKTGATVITPQFDTAESFSDGVASVGYVLPGLDKSRQAPFVVPVHTLPRRYQLPRRHGC
jgi:tetratricopeptide (TPR) repeat protein